MGTCVKGLVSKLMDTCGQTGLEKEVPDPGHKSQKSQKGQIERPTYVTCHAVPFPKPLLLLANHGSD